MGTLRNWFTDSYTREKEHRQKLFELEAEHKYLEAAITQLWDYIVIIEADLAKKVAKLDIPTSNRRTRPSVSVLEEQEAEDPPGLPKGMRVFGGKSAVRVAHGSGRDN